MHTATEEEYYVDERVLEMEAAGKPERGRPKLSCMDLIREDIKVLGQEEKDAGDRQFWRYGIQNSNRGWSRTC